MGHSITSQIPCRRSTRQSRLRFGISSREPNRTVRAANSCRRGAVAVEFAIVSLPLFLFVFGIVEFGRGMMAIHAMEEAARAGCRRAIVRDASADEVKAEVDRLMDGIGVDKYRVTIEPADVASAARWQPISVTVEAKYKDMALFSGPLFLKDLKLASSCTFAKEGAQEN